MTVRAFVVPRAYCLWNDQNKFEFLRQNAPRAPWPRLQRVYDMLQIHCAARSVGGERQPRRIALSLSRPAGQTSQRDVIATVDVETGDVTLHRDGGNWPRLLAVFAGGAAAGFLFARQ